MKEDLFAFSPAAFQFRLHFSLSFVGFSAAEFIAPKHPSAARKQKKEVKLPEWNSNLPSALKFLASFIFRSQILTYCYNIFFIIQSICRTHQISFILQTNCGEMMRWELGCVWNSASFQTHLSRKEKKRRPQPSRKAINWVEFQLRWVGCLFSFILSALGIDLIPKINSFQANNNLSFIPAH